MMLSLAAKLVSTGGLINRRARPDANVIQRRHSSRLPRWYGNRRAQRARRKPREGRRAAIFSAWLTQRSERRPQLGTEQLRLLPRRKVSTLVDFVEVNQIAIGAPGPGLRGAVELPRKYRDGDRERDIGSHLRSRKGRA